MNIWHHMELSDSRGFGWDGRHMLYKVTIDGWNDYEHFSDVETIATIRLSMDPDTAEREFYVDFHHEKSETNIGLLRMVDNAIDLLLQDSRVDLDEGVREHDPLFSQLDFDEED